MGGPGLNISLHSIIFTRLLLLWTAADCLRAAETREVLPSNGPDETGIIPADDEDEDSFYRWFPISQRAQDLMGCGKNS